jgi:hypothetical protein
MKPKVAPVALVALVALFMGCGTTPSEPGMRAVQAPLVQAMLPLHFAIEFPEESTLLPDLSSACGFDVFLTFQGTSRGILFFDGDGTLSREVDAGGVLKVSLASSSNALTFPLAALHTTYEGDADGNVTVGSRAVVTITGFSLSPFARSAGRVVFDAVVIAITGEGVPVVDFIGAPRLFAGHAGELEANCEGLVEQS